MEIDRPDDLPESLATVLEQQEPETLVAVHAYCEGLIERHEFLDEVEHRTLG